ncbi:NAD-dependent epimerase/dehydratase family protein [Chloroflexota bacterium]
MASLITGGTGLVGAELAHILVKEGEEVVVFNRNIRHDRIDDIEDKVKAVSGDLGDWSQVMNVVKDNKITDIYHMGAMLSRVSEDNHSGSFQANIMGSYYVLEAARLFNVKRMMFTSSIATFGLGREDVVSDTTIQRPTMIYGVAKLYIEGLGRWYRNKFGLDFRSIRYPDVEGPSVRTPGHWVPYMIEDAVLGKQHDSLAPETRGTWMISVQDAARAAYGVLHADKESIKMVNYNVTGPNDPVYAKDIEAAIKKIIPEFKVTYPPEQPGPGPRMGRIGRFDDSCAREEWGWKPEHPTVEQIVEAFIEAMRAHPQRYGLK